jgi:hypothetical protein
MILAITHIPPEGEWLAQRRNRLPAFNLYSFPRFPPHLRASAVNSEPAPVTDFETLYLPYYQLFI